MLATAPSITGNNYLFDGGSNDVESHEDVGDGVKEYYTKITDHLSFGRGSSFKEPGEMTGDDLQGSRLSYAIYSYN